MCGVLGDVAKTVKGLLALGIERGEKVAVSTINLPHRKSCSWRPLASGPILPSIDTTTAHRNSPVPLGQPEAENPLIIDEYRDIDHFAPSTISYEASPGNLKIA